MKVLCLMTLLVLCASVAGAQDPWPYNDNNIGIYFDEGASRYCCGSPPGSFVDMYLILTSPTYATVGGWEAKIHFEGAGATPVSFIARYPNVNAATIPNEYIIGFGTPQPALDGILVLMDIRLYVVDGMIPVYGYVGPTYFHTADEALPAYVNGADLNVVQVMYPRTGGINDWVVSLNNGCVVDTESASFGTVKSLFR